MRPPSFPDPRTARLQAGIFASDLRLRSAQVFEVYASERTATELSGVACEVLRLPVTIPIDERGIVLLGPATLDCDKKAAVMELLRPLSPGLPYPLGIGLALVDGTPMLVPGVNRTGAEADPPEPVYELTFAVSDAGFAVVGLGPDGAPLDVSLSENTACLLSTALLIAFGVKLVRAERGLY